jgi:outer membrane protein
MNGKILPAVLSGALLCAANFAVAGQAVAEEWTDGFMLRLRGISIVPDESSSVSAIGGEVDVGNAVVPELDISYFFTENFALELILATAKHDAEVQGSALGTVDVGDFWILPPTLLAQYHLPLNENWKPYVGAGVNYTIVYGEDAAGGTVTNLDIDNGFGLALQAGVDYFIDEHWFLNADVKKLWLNVDAKVNGGAVRADIDVDPWIFGVGFGYRF